MRFVPAETKAGSGRSFTPVRRGWWGGQSLTQSALSFAYSVETKSGGVDLFLKESNEQVISIF